MNVEEDRLNTFSDWPQDAAVNPSRIARAGFFFTKHDLTVECFSCHSQITEWNYGDQVMARHRTLSPNCPFVLNPTTSGNVPIIPPVPSASSTSTTTTTTTIATGSDFLEIEANRLKTFSNWPVPHIVSPERLARAGFYYLRTGDNTKCVYCHGVVRSWEPGDDPDREHQRHFENCPFVIREILPRLQPPAEAPANNAQSDSTTPTSNRQDQRNKPPPPPYSNVNLVVDEDLHRLGVQTHKRPKKQNYATLESRLRSFVLWPRDLIQTPDILAQAGFYYEGIADQVRCFHCDGGLRHWDPQDDPWTEHARWFPNCPFIKLVKGQEFVVACSTGQNNVNSNLEKVGQKGNSTPATKKREVSERELQEHMTSEVALNALGIGLNVERVKRAIREKIEQTGCPYSQTDALVEAALNLQHDEEDINEENENSSRSGNSVGVYNQVKNVVSNVLDNLIAKSSNNDDNDDKCDANNSETQSNLDNNRCLNRDIKLNKTVSLEEENRILKEARLCKICMDAEVGIVFLPCGHLATCVNCAPNLEACPVCRSAIKATVRTFLS